MDKPDLAHPGAGPGHAEASLRILLVVNLPWDSRLGAIRVFMELAEQWRSAGHTVEKFSASEAFAGDASPAFSELRRILFGYRAAAFVRRNEGRFDVIDALIGSLHGTKESMRFRDLLVARSVGLYRLYDRFDEEAARRWPAPQARLFTRLFYTKTGKWFRKLSDAAVRHADVFNVPNEEERQFLVAQGTAEDRITVQHYGLSPDRRIALRRAALPAQRRLERPKICFIGMWSPRKGARDWETILKLVWQQVPEVRFAFLGTMTDSEIVLRDLGLRFSERIEIVPDYAQTELPGLLSECTVGAFPSYVEGFGIAVLEQLGAGVPTVAFDVAGPRDMLKFAAPALLVPPGDVTAFAAALVRILQTNLPSYEKLSEHCKKVAETFDWTVIARETARVYRDYLTRREPATPAAPAHES